MSTEKAEIGDYIELWEIISKNQTTISWTKKDPDLYPNWHKVRFPVVKCTEYEITILLDGTPHATKSWTRKDEYNRKVYDLLIGVVCDDGALVIKAIKQFKCKYCENL